MRFGCRNTVPRHIRRKKDRRKTYRSGRTRSSARMVFSCARNVWNDIYLRRWIIATQKQEERKREQRDVLFVQSAVGNINYWRIWRYACGLPYRCRVECRTIHSAVILSLAIVERSAGERTNVCCGAIDTSSRNRQSAIALHCARTTWQWMTTRYQ